MASDSPAAAAIASDNGTAIIVGATVGAVLGIAIIAIVVALIVSAKFRYKILPFAAARDHAKKQDLGEITDESGASLHPQSPRWASGKVAVDPPAPDSMNE